MVNDYGEKLDKHGYAPSLWLTGSCVACGISGIPLARHEVFHGAYRTKSKALGCWVNLCPNCHAKLHTGKKDLDRFLKYEMQKTCMEHYGWSIQDFRERFGKNYLEAGDE